MPIVSTSQKLSKIETLRLARNYIALMSAIVNGDANQPTSMQIVKFLTIGLSQATSNTISSLLGLNSRSIINVNATGGHSATATTPRSRAQNAFQLTETMTRFRVLADQQESSDNHNEIHASNSATINLDTCAWNCLLNEIQFNDSSMDLPY